MVWQLPGARHAGCRGSQDQAKARSGCGPTSGPKSVELMAEQGGAGLWRAGSSPVAASLMWGPETQAGQGAPG